MCEHSKVVISGVVTVFPHFLINLEVNTLSFCSPQQSSIPPALLLVIFPKSEVNPTISLKLAEDYIALIRLDSASIESGENQFETGSKCGINFGMTTPQSSIHEYFVHSKSFFRQPG